MKKENHKDMKMGNAYVFPDNEHPLNGVDLVQSGSLIVEDNEISFPKQYVRGPFWRAEKGNPTVEEADVRPLRVVEREIDYNNTTVGSELELFAFDIATGELFPIMHPQSPIRNELTQGNGGAFHEQASVIEEVPDELDFSDELMSGQIEVNFKHSNNTKDHAISQIRALRRLTSVVESHGAVIVPISTLPHRPLEISDINPNAYVQRIALDHMGWERVRHFTGSSLQTHAEISNSEAALQAINFLQQLTPTVIAISAASPFMNGRNTLDSSDISGVEVQSCWQATRYPNRFVGSPSGGVITHPAPGTLTEFFESAQAQLADNSSPTIGRVFGHHADFRLRLDIGDNGTIEAAVADSFGGHPLKIAAMGELYKAQAVKLQAAIMDRRQHNLPEHLFGNLTQTMLDSIHQDSYAASQHGLNATITQPNGVSVNVARHFENVVDWSSEAEPEIGYDGLAQGVVNELKKSAVIVSEEEFQQFDPSSDSFVMGFYKSGLGTLSQWLHRRVDHLTQTENMEATAAIMKSTLELGHAYHEYLQDPTLEEQVSNMFRV